MATSVRTSIDCREFPNENDCTLTSHEHERTPELREMLRAGLREERA